MSVSCYKSKANLKFEHISKPTQLELYVFEPGGGGGGGLLVSEFLVEYAARLSKP